MEEHTTNLIELLVNNKKKKRGEDANKDLRIKLFEILDVIIDENISQNNDLKKNLIEFFNLYISINTYIVKHHGNIREVKNIVDTMINNVVSKTETINSDEITKVINLVKDKKDKFEFINIEKIT